MKFRFRLALAPAAVAAFMVTSVPARAFDTGPHFDMTRDALTSEGFGDVPIRIIQISNWFCDLYEQDDRNAFSGHQSWNSGTGIFTNLLTLFRKENWPQALVDAAEKLHFDSSNPINNYAQAQTEWYRLARKTRELLRDCARRNDLEGMLAIMGATLHGVQDFYTHSNWVEPKGDRRALGGSGPGWAARRTFGTHPTIFDVPEAERAKEDIFSQKIPGSEFSTTTSTPGARPPTTSVRPPRIFTRPDGTIVRDHRNREVEIRDHRAGSVKVGHGGWDTPASGSGNTLGMNKDSVNRPYFEQAYTTAYIASRQWIQAMRSWIGDEAVWARLRQFANTHGSDLDHDQKGAFELSWHVGHWNGNEGVKSNFVDIGKAGIRYFDGHSKTFFRRKFETLATELVKSPVTNEPADVPSSSSFAGATTFVIVRVTRLHQLDETFDIDPGSDADYFMDAYIGGQKFRSCIVNGKDTFTFPPPYAPITFIKAVPVGQNVGMRLQLWDDDLFTKSDQADIGPAKGVKEVRLTYDPRTATISGDLNGRGTMVARGSENDKAEITFRIETMPVTAPPNPALHNVLKVQPGILQFKVQP